MLTIITESISCMTAADCEKYGVVLLPLSIVSGGVKKTDYIGDYVLTDDSFTLPPSEYDYYRAMFDSVRAGNKVLCITLSQKLSQAYANAAESAKQFSENDVAVVDSKTCAGGQMLMVMKARELEASGMRFENIVKALNDYREKVSLSFALTDIKAIRRSKRISTFSRGNMPILNQRPIFYMKNGGVNYIEGSNSLFGCTRKLQQSLSNPECIILHHSSDMEQRDLSEAVSKRFSQARIITRPVTASLIVNVGNVIGVAGDGNSPKNL